MQFRLISCTALVLVLATSQARGQALDRLEQSLRQRDNQQQQEPGYLGVIADDRNENSAGVRIIDVVEKGPAESSGLKKDDLVVSIDGRAVRKMEDMGRALQGSPVGRRMIFEVERDGRRQQVAVTLGRRPAPEDRRFREFGRIPEDPPQQDDDGKPKLGVLTIAVTDQSRFRLRLPTTSGAQITRVNPGSTAEAAGLRVDDVIVALDGNTVRRSEDLSELIRLAGAGREIEISYYRDGELSRTKAQLAGGSSNAVAPRGSGDELPDPGQRPSGDPRNMDDKQRIEMLERAVGELQRRVVELEQALKDNGSTSSRPKREPLGPALPPPN